MLRDLLDVWRGRDLLGRMFNDFQEMLRKADWMFAAVSDVLLGKRVLSEIRDELYRKDKEVNEFERSIRREIVQNLMTRPNADVEASLVFMSVVKDAERIGDYCKNLFEVAVEYSMVGDDTPQVVVLEGFRARVASLISRTRAAFVARDEAEASRIVADAEKLAADCDELIFALYGLELPARKAIAYVLMARYFKRIASHLRNIASAVTGSVEELDYPHGPAHGRLKGI